MLLPTVPLQPAADRHGQHAQHQRQQDRRGGAAGGDRPPGEEEDEAWGLPDSIRLGLGDFIFYSVLVGRAAMYDMLTVYAAYLAIVAGLGARTSPWLAAKRQCGGVYVVSSYASSMHASL